jgi:hypothetical protein
MKGMSEKGTYLTEEDEGYEAEEGDKRRGRHGEA